MTEWKLFPNRTVPVFTTVEFFENHPWVPPGHQRGHEQRQAMVSKLIEDWHEAEHFTSLTDLGCGDGSLLTLLKPLGIPMWGYEAGVENVDQAWKVGLDVRKANILDNNLEYGQLIVASEVIEHLLDPHGFVKALPGRWLVLSSPSAENAFWHYEHHAWAWDMAGYATMVTDAGWTVVEHRECDAEENFHNNMWKPQRFQALVAMR